MNNQEIFELMAHFDASTAARLKLTMGEFSLELEKAVAAPIPAAAGTAVSGAARSSRGRTGFTTTASDTAAKG